MTPLVCSGSNSDIGKISKRGHRYLRKQLIHSAKAPLNRYNNDTMRSKCEAKRSHIDMALIRRWLQSLMNLHVLSGIYYKKMWHTNPKQCRPNMKTLPHDLIYKWLPIRNYLRSKRQKERPYPAG
ncbi:transposase [Pseudoalteromonas tunicata]|uniref:transposase n=1 Tax=Pseudoalteromonas tunicata TaxID=314281 RepID=UPI0034DCDF36